MAVLELFQMIIKKVLVTGSNGFVGRHACKRLKELGSKLLLLLIIENLSM
ncbi:MAG: NAD-dependent epimerase/dehydratase family protein [Nitrososphaerota archaeon]|jgi:nucleoside-diphosphate-sugar epimerase